MTDWYLEPAREANVDVEMGRRVSSRTKKRRRIFVQDREQWRMPEEAFSNRQTEIPRDVL